MGVKLPMVDTFFGIELEKGCKIIAIILLVLAVLGFIFQAVHLSIFDVILAVVTLALAVLLFLGITRQNMQYIKIYLIVEAVMIILSIISFIVDLVQIFTVSGAATINLIWSLLFVLRIYFWICIFSHYQKSIGGTGEIGGPSTSQPA